MESKNDPQFWKAEGFYDLQTQAKTQKKKKWRSELCVLPLTWFVLEFIHFEF